MNSTRRQIYALAWPAIITNITTPLMGLIDVAITGHLGSAIYLAAIALGGTLFNMTYWLLNFLRMGTSGITAREVGAGDLHQARLALCRSLAIAATLATVVLALSPLIGNIGLDMLDGHGETRHQALRYFMIAVWGAPAVLATYAFAGWFIGMQDTRPVMYSAITTNIVNIALSTAFVYALDLGIVGVAAGTAIAQWVGLAVAYLYARAKLGGRIWAVRGAEVFHRQKLREFFSVNVFIFLRTLCLITVTTLFTRAGASMGAVTLAANAVLMQFFMLFSFFIDGFAYAAEAMVGLAVGAGNTGERDKTVRSLFACGLTMAIVATAVYFLFCHPMLRVLTNDSSVIDAAGMYVGYAILIPVVSFSAFIWDGVFIGMGWTRRMFLSMLSAAAIFIMCYYVTMAGTASNHGLWISFLAYLLTRGVMQWLMYARDREK